MVDKKLLREASAHRALFVLSVLFGLGSAAAILLQTWCVAVTVNGMFMEGKGLQDLLPSFGVALLALAVRIGLDCAEEVCSLRLAGAVKESLRERFVNKLGTLSPVQVEYV